MNFSKIFLHWLVDCLSHWQPYVQIDDKRSKKVQLGVPQGSMLRPILFYMFQIRRRTSHNLVHIYNMQIIRPFPDNLNQNT